MIASMTGYGKSENKNKNFSINVEIKSVNNRFFEPILKLPHSIKDYEQIITNLLRERVTTYSGLMAGTIRIGKRNKTQNQQGLDAL